MYPFGMFFGIGEALHCRICATAKWMCNTQHTNIAYIIHCYIVEQGHQTSVIFGRSANRVSTVATRYFRRLVLYALYIVLFTNGSIKFPGNFY